MQVTVNEEKKYLNFAFIVVSNLTNVAFNRAGRLFLELQLNMLETTFTRLTKGGNK